MPYGSPWSKDFVRQLADKEVRQEFVADQIRTRIALLIRALREQEDRDWTQSELGHRAGKPQNVISRLEDPDYGKASLQTLLGVAAAFDLPLWVDIPEWEDWFQLVRDVPNSQTRRASFNMQRLLSNEPLPYVATSETTEITIHPLTGPMAPFSNDGLVLLKPRTRELAQKDAEIARLRDRVTRLEHALMVPGTVNRAPQSPFDLMSDRFGNSISVGSPAAI